MARDVAERLVDDAQQVGGDLLVGLGLHVAPTCSSTSIIELWRNSSTIATSPTIRVVPPRSSGPQAEDEVADVPDRQVEAVDRALDPPLDLVRVVCEELGTSSSDSPTP